MTVRALAGLALLQGMYLAAGASVLFALRGWSTRLFGLSYLLGVATLGVLWTVLLTAGVPFGGVTILLCAAGVVAVGVAVGVRRGFRARFPLERYRGQA